MWRTARLTPAAVALLVIGCTDQRAAGPLGVGPSFLTVAADCEAQIATLRGQTSSATFTGKNAQANLTGLQGKLDNGSAKLSDVKYPDAIGKLTDYRDRVTTLWAQGKIGPSGDGSVTPAGLVAGADGAIACVQQLIDGV